MNRRSFMGLLGIAPAALKAAPVATAVGTGSLFNPVRPISTSAVRAIIDMPEGIHIRYVKNFEDPQKSRIDLLPRFALLYPPEYSVRVVG